MTAVRGRRLLLALAASLTLAGCGGASYDLPHAGQRTAALDPSAVAEAYATCLREAGLPVGFDSGGSRVDLAFGDEDSFVYETPTGVTLSSGIVDEQTASVFAALTGEGVYRLAWNGENWSDTVQECHDATGYSDGQGGAADSAELDQDTLNAMIDASLAWAACARGQGWTGVTDPVRGVSSAEPPRALLPRAITEEQLKALLRLCPTTAEEMAGQSASPVVRVRPLIGFDYPGFDGRSVGASPPDGPETVRLTRLMEIIYEGADDGLAGGEGPR
ncbi:MAG: hypothetical protein LBH76_07010 [Propionibacteriaceae bacterium]|jgi:hypothetical protein|nr:hypothetical protein [Propionibacteriaceae bacterium]